MTLTGLISFLHCNIGAYVEIPLRRIDRSKPSLSIIITRKRRYEKDTSLDQYGFFVYFSSQRVIFIYLLSIELFEGLSKLIRLKE